MTVTKTCIEVLQDLGQSFQQVMSEKFKPPSTVAPYFVQNDTGFEITLVFKDSSFYLHESHLPKHGNQKEDTKLVFESEDTQDVRGRDVVSCTVLPGDGVYLELKGSVLQKELTANESSKATIDSSSLVQKPKYLHLQVGQIEKDLKVPVYKTDKRYFPLYRDTQEEPWGIVSDVQVELGITKLNLHGIVQVSCSLPNKSNN